MGREGPAHIDVVKVGPLNRMLVAQSLTEDAGYSGAVLKEKKNWWWCFF
jgi:hypothetical protein